MRVIGSQTSRPDLAARRSLSRPGPAWPWLAPSNVDRTVAFAVVTWGYRQVFVIAGVRSGPVCRHFGSWSTVCW